MLARISALVRAPCSMSRRALSSMRDAHVTLGVARGASAAELKAAYREKALATHPDRHDVEDREAAERAFKEISEAYEHLSGGERRRAPGSSMTKAEAERFFWDIFGADGDVTLAWRVRGRRVRVRAGVHGRGVRDHAQLHGRRHRVQRPRELRARRVLLPPGVRGRVVRGDDPYPLLAVTSRY